MTRRSSSGHPPGAPRPTRSTFSERTGWDLSPNRLTAALDRLRRSGRQILDLTESNPTRCRLDRPDEAILACLAKPDGLRYDPDPRGLKATRLAIAQHYLARGARISPERLVLTSGTSEAYSLLFRLVADPGDSILVPSPAYPLFDLLAQINDVTLVPYPLSVDLDFAVDEESLSRALAPRTRAVIVVNPGNPSGTFLKASELERLVAICAPRGIPLICDEVFGDYAFRSAQEKSFSCAGESRALCFVLNGLSKMLALPQLKLAWIAVWGPEPVAEEALGRLEILSDTFLSVGTPIQVALPDLLALAPRIQASVKDRVEANRSRLERLTAASRGCRLVLAEGGWSAVISVPRVRSEEELALSLLEADGVLAHPGYFFDFPREGYLVVSLLPHPEVFEPAIERLVARSDAST